ncbi:AtpZ/AtpI family protein [Rosistilla oblonga]|uniref:AtpZ/AtpI family protein n=1 Tax=Rosistilla oblonga TaxID=2527990 RepID=UPI0018D22988
MINNGSHRAAGHSEVQTLAGSDDDKPSYLRFAGAGLELAGAMFVPATIGYLIDSHFMWQTPWGFLIGGILGFSAGMYNFIRLANKLNQ